MTEPAVHSSEPSEPSDPRPAARAGVRRSRFSFDRLLTFRERVDKQAGRVDAATLELLEAEYAKKRAEVAAAEGTTPEGIEARVQETLYGDELAHADDAIIGKAFRTSLGVIAVLAVIGLAAWWWLSRPAPQAAEQAIETVPPEAVETVSEAPQVAFSEVAVAHGIDFIHYNGAYGDKLLPETMGGGGAFFDYDGDGDPDLLLVNGAPWPQHGGGARPTQKLFVNDGHGRFADVTAAAGLDVTFYGQGVAVADYDDDGDPDLFFTAVGKNHLFHNRGGRFVEVTDRAGVGGDADRWSSAAAFFDYDGDGDLDLFVGNYVRWSKEIDFEVDYRLTGVGRAYGPPTNYQGAHPYLYRNDGDGTLHRRLRRGRHPGDQPGDRRAGGQGARPGAGGRRPRRPHRPAGRQRHGGQLPLPQPRRRHLRGGRRLLRPGLRPHGAGHRRHGRRRRRVPRRRRSRLRDRQLRQRDDLALRRPGRPDAVRRRVDRRGDRRAEPRRPDVRRLPLRLRPRRPPRRAADQRPPRGGDQHRRSEPALPPAGAALLERRRRRALDLRAGGAGDHRRLGQPIVGRGSAYADIDGDGDLDVALFQVADRVLLFENDQQLGHHWLRVDLVGDPARGVSRDAIGARLELTAGGHTQVRTVMPFKSYLSQSQRAVTFGLGDTAKVDSLKVIWPNGDEQLIGTVPLDRRLVVRQGEGG